MSTRYPDLTPALMSSLSRIAFCVLTCVAAFSFGVSDVFAQPTFVGSSYTEDAYATETIGVTTVVNSQSNSVSGSAIASVGGGTASAGALGGLDPSVSASANTTLYSSYAYGVSSLAAQFAVVGPVGGVSSVPIDVSVSGGALSTSSGYSSYASITITGALSGYYQEQWYNGLPTPIGGGLRIDVAPNTAVSFMEVAWAQSGVNLNPPTPPVSFGIPPPNGPSTGIGSASAYADPLFSIDPAFLYDHTGYSIVFSPGLITTSPIPEPGTLPLLGGGLALVLAWAKRSRGKA